MDRVTLAYIIRAELEKYRPDAPITVQDLKATSKLLAATPSHTIAHILREVAEPHPGYEVAAHDRVYWRRRVKV